MEQEPPFPDPDCNSDDNIVRLEISDIFDLHSVPPRDVKAVVEAYLEEAHRMHFSCIRIIHGRGIGVQREMVRSILARTPFVIRFSDAPPEAGGRGATIADLSTDSEGADTSR